MGFSSIFYFKEYARCVLTLKHFFRTAFVSFKCILLAIFQTANYYIKPMHQSSLNIFRASKVFYLNISIV